MTPNILITGRGTSGSWQIRGEQIGRAIGATVQASAPPSAAILREFDAVVMVKRLQPDLVRACHLARVPLIWDVVDAWPQPIGNTWSAPEALAWLAHQVRQISPAGIVAATARMADDLRTMSGAPPVFHLPHHARTGQALNPVRQHVQTVGYEGSPQYITAWRPDIEAECAARGWRFVVNPARLADVDIVLALRDAAGYPARHWKSNVKLANAQGSGTPFVGCREAGYQELAIGGSERWADTPRELRKAFDTLTPHDERVRVSRWMLAAAPHIDTLAARYKAWLQTVCRKTSSPVATC